MKLRRERNLYLRRIFSEEPHKYSYDMSSGKWALIDEAGAQREVSRIGALRPRFHPRLTGVASHRTREQDSERDPAALHFAPSTDPPASFRNAAPRKFAGYAQCPYQLHDSLSYLHPATTRPQIKHPQAQIKPKYRSLTERSEQNTSESLILAASLSMCDSDQEAFFKKAWGSISGSRPTPKTKKKSCYSDKCRFLKQMAVESLIARKESSQEQRGGMLGLSFHEQTLKQEREESKRLAKLGLATLRK